MVERIVGSLGTIRKRIVKCEFCESMKGFTIGGMGDSMLYYCKDCGKENYRVDLGHENK
jgi:translation initiation factor 2 beta subunit (eIF-2beta)/eIF-5